MSVHGSQRSAHRLGGYRTSRRISHSSLHEVVAGPGPEPRWKRPPATGPNPYLVLAALLAVLAISWVPVAILLIWVL
jgi:hypothetical protein